MDLDSPNSWQKCSLRFFRFAKRFQMILETDFRFCVYGFQNHLDSEMHLEYKQIPVMSLCVCVCVPKDKYCNDLAFPVWLWYCGPKDTASVGLNHCRFLHIEDLLRGCRPFLWSLTLKSELLETRLGRFSPGRIHTDIIGEKLCDPRFPCLEPAFGLPVCRQLQACRVLFRRYASRNYNQLRRKL